MHILFQQSNAIIIPKAQILFCAYYYIIFPLGNTVKNVMWHTDKLQNSKMAVFETSPLTIPYFFSYHNST